MSFSCHVVLCFFVPRSSRRSSRATIYIKASEVFEPLGFKWREPSSLPTWWWVAPAYSHLSDKLILISSALVCGPPAAAQREPCQRFLFQASIIFTSGRGCETEEGSARSPRGDKERFCSAVTTPPLWLTTGSSKKKKKEILDGLLLSHESAWGRSRTIDNKQNWNQMIHLSLFNKMIRHNSHYHFPPRKVLCAAKLAHHTRESRHQSAGKCLFGNVCTCVVRFTTLRESNANQSIKTKTNRCR